MKVTFADFGPEIASSRLRAAIPQRELASMGIDKGRDVLVYGKHVVSMEQARKFDKRIFDICDDHFKTEGLRDYYMQHALAADVVTCNSEVMQQIIKDQTGRDAHIVLEPYESAEHLPNIGPRLLWFGHASNLADLERITPRLRHPLLALSNHPDCATWSMETQQHAMLNPCIVIIPTGKSLAKSENRMVEAIRNGKYVCAEHLPSYEQFSRFFPLGEIPEHIEYALVDEAKSLDAVRAAQDYIRNRYSPRTIAKQWLEVINGA